MKINVTATIDVNALVYEIRFKSPIGRENWVRATGTEEQKNVIQEMQADGLTIVSIIPIGFYNKA